MNFFEIALLFIATGLIFFIIDLLWLGIIAKNFYRKHLAGILREKFSFGPALVFYVIYVIGLLVFVTLPAIESGSIVQAVGEGALFGLVAYATYDLSNWATLKNWPVKVVAADIIWGMMLSSAVATASFVIGNTLNST